MIETLKTVEIEKLSKEEVLEHIKNVLTLDEKEIIEYLKYAIDNQYKEEDENSEIVEFFFKTEEFKPYYNIILNAENEK
ncbi:MAG: hypothetical protein HPY57_14530 [Ignavibacteria bacterium]|nr:hypothetical protein [Ignavibacteria bacterium]